MYQRSSISHCFIPCPGIDRCKFYKPSQANHPRHHSVGKVTKTCDKSFASYTSSAVPRNRSNGKRLVLSGVFLDNLAPVPFDPRVDPPRSNVCFNCWRTNHLLVDCYVRKRNKFCSNCGRKFVRVDDCPRCAKAYYEYIEEDEHIRAKIELYGNTESPDFREPTKVIDLKPAESENYSQCPSLKKEEKSWDDGSFDDYSGKDVSTDYVGTNKSNYEGECKNDYTNELTSTVKELKSMNLNGKEQDEYERSSSSYCTGQIKREENYEDFSELDESTCFTTNGKLQNLEKSHNSDSFASILDDENEDYDNTIFVDEDEQSVTLGVTENNFQVYRHLLSLIKQLPVEAQDVAVRCFVNFQKKKN